MNLNPSSQLNLKMHPVFLQRIKSAAEKANLDSSTLVKLATIQLVRLIETTD